MPCQCPASALRVLCELSYPCPPRTSRLAPRKLPPGLSPNPSVPEALVSGRFCSDFLMLTRNSLRCNSIFSGFEGRVHPLILTRLLCECCASARDFPGIEAIINYLIIYFFFGRAGACHSCHSCHFEKLFGKAQKTPRILFVSGPYRATFRNDRNDKNDKLQPARKKK